VSEITFAARRLLRDRWSTLAAIVVAGLGAGLNTAVFAFAYGVLLRPLPYRDAGRLAILNVSVPFAGIDDWRHQLSTLDRVGAYAREGLTVRGLGEPRYVPAAVVDSGFFDVLATPALVGQLLSAHDSGAVAVLSERLARQAGGSLDSLIGRGITVADTPVTVVGIVPDAFGVPSAATEVWIPVGAAPPIPFDSSRNERRGQLVGRMKTGVSIADVRQEISRVGAALDPEFRRRPTARVTLLSDDLLGAVRPVLLVFAASAVVALLVACANVATILIGRTIARRRELAIRAAIGASRSALFSTILSESILIGLAGAAVGALVAAGAVRVVSAWAAGFVPRLGEVRIDWPVLGFALAVAMLSAIVAPLPALRSIGAPAAVALREGVGVSRAGRRMRALLAMSQIALAVVLLGAGGLLVRTILELLRADIGVDSRDAMVTQLMVTDSPSFKAIGRQMFLRDLLQRLHALPTVVAAGAGSSVPPDNAQLEMTVRLAMNGRDERTYALSLTAVTPGYLEALGAHLLQGRFFQDPDSTRADLVTMLSESAARAFMPNVDPVDRQLPFALPGMRARGHATVLGVVADIKYSGLESSAGPSIYVLWKELPAGRLYLSVRTRGDALASAPAIRAVLREVDPRLPVMPIGRLDDVVQRSAADRRLRALLAGSVALLALAIALVGLAGGLGRMVVERRRELAIRSALGATPARMVRSVMVDGTLLAGAGITAGVLMTLAAGNVLRAFVFGISPHDPATLGSVVLAVAIGSLLACYLPARRAAAANPLEILRGE
jgi:putative ABC transport system permease protein